MIYNQGSWIIILDITCLRPGCWELKVLWETWNHTKYATYIMRRVRTSKHGVVLRLVKSSSIWEFKFHKPHNSPAIRHSTQNQMCSTLSLSPSPKEPKNQKAGLLYFIKNPGGRMDILHIIYKLSGPRIRWRWQTKKGAEHTRFILYYYRPA